MKNQISLFLLYQLQGLKQLKLQKKIYCRAATLLLSALGQGCLRLHSHLSEAPKQQQRQWCEEEEPPEGEEKKQQ